MEAQDAATTYFFKLWEWIESNVRTIVIGAAIVVVAAILLAYYFWRQNEMELTAGEALTQALVSPPPNSDASQLANAYLKIASDYPDTQAGGRALMLGAATLFSGGKYPDAQTQFQKYLGEHPSGAFSASAALGVASCLDAQAKTNLAADAYQRVINSYSDPNAVGAAKFGLAKINEQRGKLTDAENLYEWVARDNPDSPLGAEAAVRILQLKSKLSASPTLSPPASFNLNSRP